MEFIKFLKDNYSSYKVPEGTTIDLQGWKMNVFDSCFESYVNKINPKLIIEVGTWKGLSAITMANKCNTETNIICIDTWLGAPEFWTTNGIHDRTRGKSLKLKDGYPTVFYTFLNNVKLSGHEDKISPFPISSIQGAEVLKHYNIKADIIYIDASHEYNQVIQDIQAYWDILNDGGVMFGDDYTDYWHGVKKAVNEFASKNNLKITIHGEGLWEIYKGQM